MRPGTLSGVRVVEFEGLGPVPFAGMLLADMGADVVRIARKKAPAAAMPVLDRGRRIVRADLKNEGERAAVERLMSKADIIIEGYRPGVMERLGLGPDKVSSSNPSVVFGRMTGWGQQGMLAKSAGHDLNYIAISGVLAAIGTKERPIPPLNVVGDYGGGALYLVSGVLAAFISRLNTGRGQVVDCAICDGAASMTAIFCDLIASGQWLNERQSNLVDGGAPFYDVYACADGKHVVLAALEPHFFEVFCRMVGLPVSTPERQLDRNAWPALRELIAGKFLERTRDDWCRVFGGTDACVSPVLDIEEAAEFGPNRERGVFIRRDGVTQPGTAPHFSHTPSAVRDSRISSIESVIQDWHDHKPLATG